MSKSISSSSSCSPAAANPARPDKPPIPAILPRPVKDVPFARPAFPNNLANPLGLVKAPKPFFSIILFNGLKLPLPKKDPKPLPPANPLNCVPGIPNVNPPNMAALPMGLLTTFFTAFLAFLKIFF